MPTAQEVTLDQAMRQVAAELDGPMPFEEFADRVLHIRPSRAKNPRASIRNKLRWESDELGVIFADIERTAVVPPRVAMQGIRFRHALDEDEITAGVLSITLDDAAFLPDRGRQKANLSNIRLLDQAGEPLLAPIVELSRRAHWLSEEITIEQSGFRVEDWFRRCSTEPGDAVLITIESYDPPVWRLMHERAADRDEAAIARRNAELVDSLYEMLERAKDERIMLRESVIVAHIQLAEPAGYPGDPWTDALNDDGRMATDGFHIMYAEELERMYGALSAFREAEGDVEVEPETTPLSAEAARQVYRFKAMPKHRKSLWRQIEILGEQTLADFNTSLVNAFKHDWDHLGGFWKLARRGNANRYREIDLGTVEPFGGGDGADVRIADLELGSGEELKWVYDFGDWHEYRLLLEEILPPTKTKAAGYPRIVGRNKAKPVYCRHCQEKGRQTVAKYICITCSNDMQEDVFVCSRCENRYHEDHYTTEHVV